MKTCVRGGPSGRTCVEHGLPLYPSGFCLGADDASDLPSSAALSRELQTARDRLLVLTVERDEFVALAELVLNSELTHDFGYSVALLPASVIEKIRQLLAERAAWDGP